MKPIILTTLIIFALAFSPAPQQGETLAGLVAYIIDYPSISPDGDGAQDTTAVEVAVLEPCDLLSVTVEDEMSTQVFDTLLAAANAGTGIYRTSWNGNDSLGIPLGEGIYTLHIMASSPDTTEDHYRTLIIDLTRPVVTIDRIEPGVLMPGFPGGSETSTIYFFLSDFAGTDSLDITVSHPDVQPEKIPMAVTGDGYYSVEWTAGNEALDGVYTVHITAYDEAGNSSFDEGFINVDLDSPSHGFIDPIPERTNAVPPVQEGWCWDRNGIETPVLTWQNGEPFPPDNTYMRNDTLFWEFNIGDSVSVPPFREETFRLDVLYSDLKGRAAADSLVFTVDMIPPAAPILDEPPLQTTDTKISITGSLSQPGSDTIYVYRTGLETDDVERRGGLTDEDFSVTMYDIDLGANYFWARARDIAGNYSLPSDTVATTLVTEKSPLGFPEVFREPDYFRIKTESAARGVEIKIYTLTGSEVRTLTGNGPSTEFEVYWDLRNDNGEEVLNGPYVLVIVTYYDSSRAVEKYFIAVVQ